jgi:hypothetical protein
MRSFKKNDLNLHYDFSLIFASTDEAVRNILKSSTHSDLAGGDSGDYNQDVFPDYVYKVKREGEDDEEEDTRSIQERF